MKKEERELLEKVAKQNEEILRREKQADKNREQETYEDPYWSNYRKQRAERGILS